MSSKYPTWIREAAEQAANDLADFCYREYDRLDWPGNLNIVKYVMQAIAKHAPKPKAKKGKA